MPLIKWIIFAILGFPVVEIAAFVAVAAAIGVLWAFVLLIATTVLGVALLRHFGTEHLVKLRVAAGGTVEALRVDGAGLIHVLGAVLLVLPGFVTDAVGLALLLPPVQRRIVALLGGRAAAPRARDGVVDLDPDEWRRERDPVLPDARKPPNRPQDGR